MSILMVPASASDAMKMLEAALGFLADADVTEMPTAVQAECLAGLERADAMEAAARAGCWPRSTPRMARCPTGSGPPGPGWCTACG